MIGVALVMALCLSLISGCTNSSSTTGTTTSSGTTKPTTQSASDSRPELLKNELNVSLPGVFPIAEETASLSVAMMQSTFVLSYDYDKNFQTKWMQDLSNIVIDLQLYPEADGTEKFNILINSGSDLPDVVIGLGANSATSRFVWGQAGKIIPLQDYYDQLGSLWYDTLANFDEYTGDELIQFLKSPDGNLYGMVDIDSQLRNHYPKRAYINREWLEKLDMKVESKMSQDDFVAFLRACKTQDLNGSGKTDDQIPMVGNTGWHGNVIEYLMNQYIYVDGTQTPGYYLLKDNVVDVPYDKDEWREGLRFIKGLYDEGLISELSFTQSFNDYVALMTADPTIVGVACSGDASKFFQTYEPMGTVVGPSGVGWHTYVPTSIRTRAAISSDCENPALAFRWLEMGYQNEYTLIQRYGIPDENWEYIEPQNVVRTMYDGLFDTSSSGISFFKQMKQVWMTEQYSHWQQAPLPCFFDTTKLVEVISADEFTGSTMMTDSVRLNHMNTPPISESQYNEARTVLNSYVSECMTRFVLGDMDIENGWDAYLHELENMNYRGLLEVDQKAYRRTIGLD
jgi:putative aldouronate transport system substrate-binding protein